MNKRPPTSSEHAPGAEPPPKELEQSTVRWLKAPENHDYPGARSFLSLNAKPKAVRRSLEKLQSKDCVTFRADDLLRASGSVLLPDTDPYVAKELTHIRDGEALAPCPIVRGSLGSGYLAQIADGYHRICAAYHVDPETEVPVHIADFA